MTAKKVRVRVPASTANLGPGFDTLGMALDLYGWIEMSVSDETRIDLYGEQLRGIPENKNNLVYTIAQRLFVEAGVHHPNLHIAMYMDIPLARGLGSSASAIVGALAAANSLIDRPLSDDDLFQIATRIEDHPDNVGASLFGGIVAAFWDGKRAEYIRIEPDNRLEALVAIPDFHLPTEEARHILPGQVSMKDAVFNVSHSSVLVAALGAGRLDMIRGAMKDALHQPYRSKLVPGMDRLLAEACEYGALGVALSGAGPTMIALVDREQVDRNKLEQLFHSRFGEAGVHAETRWLRPCSEGVTILATDDSFHTLFTTNKGEVRA